MAWITFVGHLGADPEWNSQTGKEARSTFSVAEEKRTPESEPNWWRCTAWGQQGEFASHFLKKGRMVYIVGELHMTKRGEKTYYDVRVSELKPLDKPPAREHTAKADEYDPFADEAVNA